MPLRLRRARKYYNIPTVVGGEKYDSQAEAARAAQLELLRKAGKIRAWRRGKNMVLVPKKKHPDGRVIIRSIQYRPDFEVEPFTVNGPTWWEDVKGVKWNKKKGRIEVRSTEAFRIKMKLWMHAYPGCELRIVDRDGNTHDTYVG